MVASDQGKVISEPLLESVAESSGGLAKDAGMHTQLGPTPSLLSRAYHLHSSS